MDEIINTINSDNFFSFLNDHNIQIHVEVMPGRIRALVYQSQRGYYHIFINESITNKRGLLAHELKHILEDAPKYPYIIGIDLQYTEMEKDAQRIELQFFR